MVGIRYNGRPDYVYRLATWISSPFDIASAEGCFPEMTRHKPRLQVDSAIVVAIHREVALSMMRMIFVNRVVSWRERAGGVGAILMRNKPGHRAGCLVDYYDLGSRIRRPSNETSGINTRCA